MQSILSRFGGAKDYSNCGDSLLNTLNLIAALYELRWNYNAWQTGHIEEYVLFCVFSKL